MKILIIKLGAAGDVLRTTSFLPLLKKKYNNARIRWLVAENAREILDGNPYLDKLIVFHKNGYLRLLKDLEKEEFALVINLEELHETSYIASCLNSEKTGFLYENGVICPTETAREFWKMSQLGPSPDNDILKKNNAKTYQELIKEMLGLTGKIERPFLSIGREDEKFAIDFLGSKGINTKDKIAGINFGSGRRWPTKRLPLNKVEELIRGIKNKEGYKIIIFGGSNEKNEINSLKNKYPDLNYANNLSIKEFAALVKYCDVLVTTDTLALHIAISQKTGVTALFGPTSAAEIDVFETGDKLISPVTCVCCYKKHCNKQPSCMELFDSEKIIRDFALGMKNRRSRRRRDKKDENS